MVTVNLNYIFAQNRPASPEGLRKSFNISEKQFFQVALFTLCLQQDWSALDTLLTTKVSYLHVTTLASPVSSCTHQVA